MHLVNQNMEHAGNNPITKDEVVSHCSSKIFVGLQHLAYTVASKLLGF